MTTRFNLVNSLHNLPSQRMFKKFALGIIAAFVVVNIAFAIFAFVSTRDRDLSIPDTAVEFQHAVFGGNFEAMWDLSAPEYRDGLTREQFIDRARDSAPPADRLFNWTVLNESSDDIARAFTRVQLASGSVQAHRIMLRQIDSEWRVTEYEGYDGPWPPEEQSLASSVFASPAPR